MLKWPNAITSETARNSRNKGFRRKQATSKILSKIFSGFKVTARYD